MTTIYEVSDYIVAMITGNSSLPWPGAFVVERAYRPTSKLGDLDDGKISVVPRRITIDAMSRKEVLRTMEIDIGVQKRIDNDFSIDSLVSLCEGLASIFMAISYSGYFCYRTQYEPINSPEHLEEYRNFVGIVSTSWRGGEQYV